MNDKQKAESYRRDLEKRSLQVVQLNKRVRELELENKSLRDNQAWYSTALEVLSQLRFHTNQLIEDVAAHNGFVSKIQTLDANTTHLKVAPRSLESTQNASKQVEAFFVGKEPPR